MPLGRNRAWETAEERAAHQCGDGGAVRRRRASGGWHGDGRRRRLRTTKARTAARSGRRCEWRGGGLKVSGAARGSHAAAGPTRQQFLNLKITPDENSSK
jgi:hypothetical protein